MDITVITQLLQNFGFPVVACIAMFYMVQKVNQQHNEETQKLSSVIEENTKVLESLKTSNDIIIKYFVKMGEE